MRYEKTPTRRFGEVGGFVEVVSRDAIPDVTIYIIDCTASRFPQASTACRDRGDGLISRPRALTADKFLEQCKYIFPGLPLISEDSVVSFNQRFGAGILGNETKVLQSTKFDNQNNAHQGIEKQIKFTCSIISLLKRAARTPPPLIL